jgi:60 kDa SS-A/Ro ribonucleoprotein
MNTRLFKNQRGALAPKADTVNDAGGFAYKRTDKEALAQYALTGTFGNAFYVTAEVQLDRALTLTEKVDDAFIAGLAVYARQFGYMKDMPAFLLAVLCARQSQYIEFVFGRVIDSARMLRTFVQIVRSGLTGRKSFGRRIKRLIRNWLTKKSDDALFRATVGQSPSVADIIKMVHPKAENRSRNALYGYLLDKEYDGRSLPKLVKRLEIPDLPFRMLTHLPLNTEQWTQIAKNMPWTALRMNLNTLARHDVFKVKGMTKFVAGKLRDPELIRLAKVFPYQLLAAYLFTLATRDVPNEIIEAIQDAMEIAIENVPEMDLRIAVCPDVSGSMDWASVTGNRGSATSKVKCTHVAGLISSIFLRRARDTILLPFECDVVNLRLNKRDSVMTNARKIARCGGGGTNVSAPLALLNQRKEQVDAVIIVSDNESWVDSRGWSARRGTDTMNKWNALRQRCPKARLVLMDLAAGDNTQVKNKGKEVYNIAGFSDVALNIMADFVVNGPNTQLVELIEQNLVESFGQYAPELKE